MDTADRAWLAGLFEGEGCIASTGRNSITLTIGMTDKDVVERCQEITQVGKIYYAPTGRTKPLWVWNVSKSDEVITVLDRIEPFLGARRTVRIAEARQRLSNVRKAGFCKRGHPMSGDNLYVSPRGQRQCRACLRRREQERIKT